MSESQQPHINDPSTPAPDAVPPSSGQTARDGAEPSPASQSEPPDLPYAMETVRVDPRDLERMRRGGQPQASLPVPPASVRRAVRAREAHRERARGSECGPGPRDRRRRPDVAGLRGRRHARRRGGDGDPALGQTRAERDGRAAGLRGGARRARADAPASRLRAGDDGFRDQCRSRGSTSCRRRVRAAGTDRPRGVGDHMARSRHDRRRPPRRNRWPGRRRSAADGRAPGRRCARDGRESPRRGGAHRTGASGLEHSDRLRPAAREPVVFSHPPRNTIARLPGLPGCCAVRRFRRIDRGSTRLPVPDAGGRCERAGGISAGLRARVGSLRGGFGGRRRRAGVGG